MSNHRHEQSHTSLPSIRDLDPYLPATMLSGSSGEPSGSSSSAPAYSYPPSHLPATEPYTGQEASSSSSYARGGGAGGDSDVEDTEYVEQGPPKKKRRRQALSCTECKRRKIKCDRNQPCAPCSRRGEAAKCHWHVVEPVTERYVTRTEFDELKIRYDELKTRFEHLENLVQRLVPSTPSSAVPSSYYQMGIPSHPSPSEAVYHQPHQQPPSGILYQPMPVGMMPAPPTYAQQRSPVSPSRPPHVQASPTSPPYSRSFPRLSHPSESSPTTHSKLALSAITTNTSASPSQSKNCRAQTFTLGERLPDRACRGGPAKLREPSWRGRPSIILAT